MSDLLMLKIQNLPESPGVYIMKQAGEIIYIGKARVLKNRVKQYFQNTRAHAPKVRRMVEKVDDFDLVLTDTEIEALMLECTLIKKHRPFYNILLKDDKQYPYIRIDISQPFPRVELARSMRKDGAKYFGPYTGATMVRDMLAVTRKIFPVRDCTRMIRKDKPQRPCIQHAIGQCLAPCAGLVEEAEYKALLDQVMHFLNGNSNEVVADLKTQMVQASIDMNYEKAALLRDRITALASIMEKQKAVDTDFDDRDILAVATDGLDAAVQALFVRGGKLMGAAQFDLPRAGDEEIGDILGSFLLQYYGKETSIPREILVEALPPEHEALENFLTEQRGGRVHLLRPVRGEKKQLVEMAKKNATDALQKATLEAEKKHARTLGACEDLGKILGLEGPARRIEAFDISHTQGMQTVAAMVVFEDGVSKNKDYRHFKIKTVEGNDDFASMREVVSRRYTRALAEKDFESSKFSTLPDVILIDGGKGQLSSAIEALKQVGLSLPVFGLAERLDEIFIPGQSKSIMLERSSPALHLVQRVRDETHRFAITYHRSLRGKAGLKSQLEDIPGVGKSRIAALYHHFKTVHAIKTASYEELVACKGMNQPAARAVFERFHPNETAQKEEISHE